MSLSAKLIQLRADAKLSRAETARACLRAARELGIGDDKAPSVGVVLGLERSGRSTVRADQTHIALLAHVYGVQYEDLAAYQLPEPLRT